MKNQKPIQQQNQQDVNPGSQLDKIINDPNENVMPETNGTGANKPIPTAGSVIIKIKEKKSSTAKNEGQEE